MMLGPPQRFLSIMQLSSYRSVVPHFARHQNKTFQQDNVRVHTARATRDYLQQNSINVMNWPALSPDLTFILK
jgi:hypothetical protein